MGRRKTVFDKSVLEKLYWGERKSLRCVAQILDCTDGTIIRAMREANIPRRTKTTMRVKYSKSPFNESLTKKAYMVGFRIGDLNVYKPYPKSSILVIRCHTTVEYQVSLIKKLFENYGGIKISHNKDHFTITCYVDNSFDFLISKALPSWVFSSGLSVGMSFVAGYTDAEGSFGLNQGRGRFKIDSYDYDVLDGITRFLCANNINVKMNKIASKGEEYGNNLHWKQDLWRININDAQSLKEFIRGISTFLRHKKRISDSNIVIENINFRKFVRTKK